jgi:hypothetical protein
MPKASRAFGGHPPRLPPQRRPDVLTRRGAADEAAIWASDSPEPCGKKRAKSFRSPCVMPVRAFSNGKAMTMIEGPTCEVQIDAVWRTLSLNDALRHHRDALKRCPACHGRVRLFRNYLRARRPVMLHDETHSGCPRIPATYSGTPSSHPQAIG